MTERWYYKARGGVLGPYSAADLAGFLRDRRIAPTDLVRRGVGGVWQPVGQALTSVPADEARGDRIAARLLAEIERAAVKGRARAPTPRRWTNFGSLGGNLWPAVRFPAADGVARFLGRLLAGGGLLATKKRLAAITFSVACAASGIWVLNRLPPSVADHHRDLAAIREAADALRRRSASPDEWRQLTLRSQADLARIAASLEDAEAGFARSSAVWRWAAARSDQESCVRHDLFLVARRHLPALLEAGPSDPGPQGAAVAERLDDIREYLAGGTPYIAEAGSSSRGRTALAAGQTSVAVVVIAAAVVVGGVGWRWRARRSFL